MARFRSHGWKPEELKVYWNVEQIENLCKQCEAENNDHVDNKKRHELKDADLDLKVEEREALAEKISNENTTESSAEIKTDVGNHLTVSRKEEIQIESKKATLLQYDPSDVDAVENLRLYPASKRNNAGKIHYVNQGIEEAVFQIPEEAQIIVLNFAVGLS